MEEFFAPGGAIGKSFADYERRAQQVEMARAVERSGI